MNGKPCDRCTHFLPAQRPMPDGEWFHVDCCTHRAVRNRHGPIAVTLARSDRGGCRPDGMHWMPRR